MRKLIYMPQQNLTYRHKKREDIIFSLLRRFDSNKRPLGYEPNELPTAPLRM